MKKWILSGVLTILLVSGSPLWAKAKIDLQVSEGYRPGARATVKVTVRNYAAKPMVVRHLSLRVLAGKKVVFSRSKGWANPIRGDLVFRKSGARVRTGFRVWEEDFSRRAVARLPMTRRELLGKDKFVSLAVLPRWKSLGESYSFTVPATGKQLTFEVGVNYSLLDYGDKTRYYVYQGSPHGLKSPKKRIVKGRWFLASEVITYYRETAKIPRTATRLLVTEAAYQKFSMVPQPITSQTAHIWQLSFGLNQALKNLGLKQAKTAIYFIPLDCWVIVANKKTHFVNWKSVQVVEGDHSKMARQANRQGYLSLEFSRWSFAKSYSKVDREKGKAKLQQVLEAYKKAGFPVVKRLQKSGRHWRVKAPAHRIVSFLKIMMETK